MALPDFVPFPKIARLSRQVVVTEKLDGTNAQVHITDDGRILASSRNRWVTPEADNFGFARWVKDHEAELATLGPGSHFGEWWGSGIQRGYGLKNGEKRFSLFNVSRWEKDPPPSCCLVVPVLWRSDFTAVDFGAILRELAHHGSHAAPGFMDPEGIVIWHEAARQLFKKTIHGDEKPKGSTEVA